MGLLYQIKRDQSALLIIVDYSELTIVIPHKDRVGMLRETLQNCLDVTSNAAEIIIIDNGSTLDNQEKLRNLVSSFGRGRLILEMHEWSSLGRARNLGLSLSSGEFIVFLDSDDLLDSEGLEEAYKVMKGDESLDVNLGGWRKFAVKEDVESGNCLPGKQITFQPSKDKLTSFFLGWDFCFNIPIHSAVFRKKSLKVHFREDVSTREDFNFWLSLVGSDLKMELSETVIAYYRRHDDQMTKETKGLHSAQAINRQTAKSFGVTPQYLIFRHGLDVLIYLFSILNKRGTKRPRKDRYRGQGF